jgi:Ca2+-binding RTX toxin-like protein
MLNSGIMAWHRGAIGCLAGLAIEIAGTPKNQATPTECHGGGWRRPNRPKQNRQNRSKNMATQNTIIESMLFGGLVGKTMNTTAQARAVVTFQFAGTSQPADFPGATGYTGWTDFTTAEKTALRAAMDHIESFLNVSFVEASSAADPVMNVAKIDIPGPTAGYGGYASQVYSSGEIAKYDNYVLYDNTLDLSSQTNLLLHELGHAMGLKHTFSTPTVPNGTDSNKYSVMSYSANPDTGQFDDSMQLYDMLALQSFWGAAGYNAADTTYTGPRNQYVDTIWDSGGTDIFDASASTTGVTLDLRQGKFSTFGSYQDVAVAYGSVIENAIGGAGRDIIQGNSANNNLSGGLQKDILRGKAGADLVNGNKGNDLLFGEKGADILKGGLGRDRLNGGAGADKLFGGKGNDAFVFKGKFGKDVIKDFADDVDTLKIQHTDAPSVSAALNLAHEANGDVIFDFSDGARITVLNTTLLALSDDITII